MKPYTWEEIKDFLIKELKKTEHIMTFGTIGSCNVNHDIDTIITKRSSSKSSEFYKELHELFNSLNKFLKERYGTRSICFFSMLEEQTLMFMNQYKKKPLRFHMMIYFSYPQIVIDWAGAQNANVREILNKEYECLIGSSKDLFSKEFMAKKYYDRLYNFLYYTDKSNSDYPKELYLSYTNKILDYITRKILKLRPLQVKNTEDIKKEFYKLCDIIDEEDKKHK